MSDVTYREIMWCERMVDIYHGDKGDEHRPYWYGQHQGDMDGGELDVVDLSNLKLPNGTRVSIQVPECPKCEQDRELCLEDDGCSFDWKNWDEDQYN